MSDLHDLLGRRAADAEPSPDALDRVLGTVARRRRRRRITAEASALVLFAVALAGFGIAFRGQGRTTASLQTENVQELVGSRPALQLRNELGILGTTKGAPLKVIVSRPSGSGASKVSVVEVGTGTTVPLAAPAEHPTISPDGQVVAEVRDDTVVVAKAARPASAPAVVPDTGGASGNVSWARDGTALYVSLRGQWVRIEHPEDPARRRIQPISVPSVPGGPVLLSISPAGDRALLFGVTQDETTGAAPIPHLFIGRFDGSAVTDVREIDVPAEALQGPMGWVGENAFLVSAGPGRALIVRTDGTTVPVASDPVGDPCAAPRAPTSCVADGPWLLGTNADGSLLFWKISAVAPDESATQAPLLVVFYKTFLDGTHAVRLTGLAGRYGPPVAAR